MVRLPSHGVRLIDHEAQAAKISAEFAGLRADHLRELGRLEDLVRDLAPLPVSYDIGRSQPPYFLEFTYTELLGGLYLAPQSSEIAARVIQAASSHPEAWGYDVVDAVLSRGAADKYKLDPPKERTIRRIAFVPGSNLFAHAVCRETLTREMDADQALVIKPHPLTNEETLRALGRLYGYHRVLPPRASGWSYLEMADDVMSTSTSEMGLYAFLRGTRVRNLTRTSFEARASYSPFYRMLWDKPPLEAKSVLMKILNSPQSGFLHPQDPDVESKAQAFFELAMSLREQFRPLLREYDPPAYTDMVLRGAQPA